MRTSTVVLIAIVWRVFAAATTRTFFQPDEFYQSLEVAHHAVFGYGHLTWEWTANPPIRSIIFPALYMPVYWVLKVTGLDDTGLLVSDTPYSTSNSDKNLDNRAESPARSPCSNYGHQHPQARERGFRR